MQQSIILGLIQNIAILLAFTMIYDYSWVKKEDSKSLIRKIIIGVLIGTIALIVMMTPWTLVPGIVFDTRSILLSVSGLFFGPVPTFIAMLMAAWYRISLGGDGAAMGVAVIISSGAIGLLWRYFRPKWHYSKKYYWELLIMGLLVHISMLLCTLFLPSDKFLTTLTTIAIPLILIYTPGTMLLGMLMLRQFANWQNRKAMNHLVEMERRFTGILENINLISVLFDKQGNITFANQYFFHTTGYTQLEVIGVNWFDHFIPKKNRERTHKIFQKILNHPDDILNHENELITKSGETLQIAWYNSILKDENGNVVGVAKIGENITTRKQNETELIEAKNKAEESDKLKSVFLANMSHEIRTPLNAIMGFSNIISKNVENDAKTLQYANIINRASHRLLQIINDIMDVSKIEAKQMNLNFTKGMAIELIHTAVETVKKSEAFAAKEKLMIKVAVNKEFEDLVLKTDLARVKQIFENLMSNAVKYSTEGTIEIGYRVVDEDNQPWFVAYVKDQGRGIPKDKYELIFQRFRQIEENMFHEGIGLGLTICKGIVELLGGFIWFESELNKGTTFYFKIPCMECQLKHTVKKTLSSTEQLLSNITILIAEDDFSSYIYLKELFNNYPIKILYAENGLKVMEILEKEVPDLILLDINMPYKSGLECLGEIKERGYDTKIIVQTAYTFSEEREKYLGLGCHGYIAKPVSKRDLFLTIHEVLNS
ncbi:MAG TPA: hypothetical protein DCQ26_11265 [Marinilabiliales bacterium]|nr:MAG: hypothetical protein A2W95_01705 [Bacteroidetes bacterium GWA2_40_14]OFX57315.1 MAG: hypothetical protein A2W84_00350 [Bacteroidetes bacterium GWC2_40_13]OFX71153.1 MAG: hypothetical protein A2W96_15565 [Bacteroidetes bacterium GWD2_40_43]OFX92364.1 MAG: hypothetical protein A2W97_10390 [Bacteroidetes bacterium GWE2_40_63]OFY22966.1 MAG: hypothetical protein A2W88_04375 [Bacteroidetes bacterium GWF2_40_13]OFZ29943.1 MAG: hypothetical protein A2437_00595 [Bacteroidetes bacterium RIFOXYC